MFPSIFFLDPVFLKDYSMFYTLPGRSILECQDMLGLLPFDVNQFSLFPTSSSLSVLHEGAPS